MEKERKAGPDGKAGLGAPGLSLKGHTALTSPSPHSLHLQSTRTAGDGRADNLIKQKMYALEEPLF